MRLFDCKKIKKLDLNFTSIENLELDLLMQLG